MKENAFYTIIIIIIIILIKYTCAHILISWEIPFFHLTKIIIVIHGAATLQKKMEKIISVLVI